MGGSFSSEFQDPRVGLEVEKQRKEKSNKRPSAEQLGCVGVWKGDQLI